MTDQVERGAVVAGALADLHNAATHAASRAALDDDPQLSLWADTAYRIELAASFLRLQQPDVTPSMAAHPHCLAGLMSAVGRIARLRPDTDVPVRDLADVLRHLTTALQHVGTEPPIATPPGTGFGEQHDPDRVATSTAATADAMGGDVVGGGDRRPDGPQDRLESGRPAGRVHRS